MWSVVAKWDALCQSWIFCCLDDNILRQIRFKRKQTAWKSDNYVKSYGRYKVGQQQNIIISSQNWQLKIAHIVIQLEGQAHRKAISN